MKLVNSTEQHINKLKFWAVSRYFIARRRRIEGELLIRGFIGTQVY